LADRFGPTTRKFDMSRGAGGDGAPESGMFGAACSEPASIAGEPAVAPPDADPYGKRRAVVVCVSGSSASSRS